jgi:polyhydroxybutyrate depolymerase
MISVPADTRKTSRVSAIRWLAVVMLTVTTSICFSGAYAPRAAAGAPSEIGCTLTGTPGTIMREIAGRPYYVNVPDSLSGPSVPLLIARHGAAQPPRLHETCTGWSDIAKTKHFIVAYPSSRQSTWDFAQGSEDVGDLRSVVRDISSVYCVDSRRVYAEGHSSGALMAARLATP